MIKPHVGILRFYSPKTQKDIVKWRKLLNRKPFKVTSNTKVCSNHFQAGYRSEECPNPTLYLKGYCPDKQKKTRPSPKKRESLAPKPKRQRRSNICLADSYSDYSEFDVSHDKSQSVSSLSKEIYCSHIHNNVKKEPEDDFSESSSSFSSLFFNGSDEISNDYDTSVEIDVSEENGKKSRRELFVKQATSNRNCFRYTGVTRENLDLVFDLIKGKAKSLRYWKGSVDTPGSRREKRRAQTRLLSCWEEFVLTLVRTRKGFDVHFLADTYFSSLLQRTSAFLHFKAETFPNFVWSNPITAKDDVGSYYPGSCSIIQPSKAANQVNYRIITVTMLNSLEVIYGIFHII
ncbi:Hypothetical predicted protein [Paramuricea clavata]|uniref:THAP-type domain-containing protein n=1 Tax=Paramuricea clavata TaxID=317549 RepID=A0A6S7GPT6_PARCT|nr:Hypothetical predicted protein [Paramuricea clavata]